jgi:hypothetical protein
MFSFPDQNKDIEVDIVAWADGRDIQRVSSITGSGVNIANDLILLRSRSKLSSNDYPIPGDAHFPANNTQATIIERPCSLFAYNRTPHPAIEGLRYPHTPAPILERALRQLCPDALSYAQGVTTATYDPDIIFHKISTHGGSPGGGIYNEQGRIVGSVFYSMGC